MHVAVALTLASLAGAAHATDVPKNLGYGLDKLVESRVMQRKQPSPDAAKFNGWATAEAARYAENAITDEAGSRFMVDVVLDGTVSVDDARKSLASKFGLDIQAVDASYRRTGIVEGYIDVDRAAALSQAKGVRSVFLALKPTVYRGPMSPNAVDGDHLNKIGTAFDQGVVQHRVDRISRLYNPNATLNYDGTGISIAAMSNSYNTAPSGVHAPADVTSFDLPGAANNPVNTQPVVVVQEGPARNDDEGRAMVQILHKMAPRARLAFASGAFGEVAFAESIRQLANLPGAPAPVDGFRADVITDDIGYGGEPFYAESIIGNAIDDASAAGVSYFSSAGNDIGINAYESDLRIVPNGTGLTAATNTALAGTNIDLTGVPPELYAGGFHNFNPVQGQLDVAQLVNMPNDGNTTELQWNDPYDLRPAVLIQPPIFSTTGTITNAVTVISYGPTSTPPVPAFTFGQPYVITETATSGDFDGIIKIYDSNDNLIVSQDTGTDEVVQFFPPASGNYRIEVNRFDTTTGDFTLEINKAEASPGVTTDLNLLVFNATTGAFVESSSLASNNIANNRPVELGETPPPSGSQVQFVIARGNVPQADAIRPTKVRWHHGGNGAPGIGPAEYFSYNAITTRGHPTSKTCNGTAAYSVFRPNLPEVFTSPGPATIYFDRDSNRLAQPEVREQPKIAAADAANTTFFTSDSSGDLDTRPNFSGTSAAAPHAAAIAALVLQAHGGPGSVTPARMTEILTRSTFPHDLDPSSATGTGYTEDGSSGVVITIDSDGESNTATGQNDVNAIKVSYVGPGSLASLTFNPAGTAAQAGHVTGGNHGVQDDAGSNPPTVKYFENNFPGLVFMPATKAFTLGTLTGLTAADIVAPTSSSPFTGFSNLAPAPSNNTSQFWTMTIGFPTGQFVDGKTMRFTVGRGVQHSAATGNGTTIGPGSTSAQPIADLFGGGVMIPSGQVIADGMAFTATTTSGQTITGRIRNHIGSGYSPVDGYGFINAEIAVGGGDLIFFDGFDPQ